MEKKQKSSGIAVFFSVVYVLAALCLLLGVCGYCYPEIGDGLRQAVAGWEESPVREAFSTLADGLEAGLPMKDTVEASFEVLFGNAT